MSDAHAHRSQQNWYPGTDATARPGPPGIVRIVAGVLTVLGLLSIVRIVATVASNLSDASWDAGARAVFLVLNAIGFVFSALYLVLAYHLWRGRLWAWITAIVLLSLTVAVGGLVLLGDLTSNEPPWVALIIAVPAVVMLLALTVSGTARRFFTRRRSFGVPATPSQPGPRHPNR
jgi:hypothetical protein